MFNFSLIICRNSVSGCFGGVFLSRLFSSDFRMVLHRFFLFVGFHTDWMKQQQQITNCTIWCIPKWALFALGLYTHSERARKRYSHINIDSVLSPNYMHNFFLQNFSLIFSRTLEHRIFTIRFSFFFCTLGFHWVFRIRSSRIRCECVRDFLDLTKFWACSFMLAVFVLLNERVL